MYRKVTKDFFFSESDDLTRGSIRESVRESEMNRKSVQSTYGPMGDVNRITVTKV